MDGFLNYFGKIIDQKSNNILILITILIIIILIIAVILIITKSSKKKPDKIEILEEIPEENNKKDNKPKPKEIPVKKTSIIDDPATVRMSIEEAKADLSNFNVKEKKDDSFDDDII